MVNNVIMIILCYFVNSTIYSYPLHTFGRIGMIGASKQSFLNSWNSKYDNKHDNDEYSRGNHLKNNLLFNDHDSSSSASSVSSLTDDSLSPLSSSLLFDDNYFDTHNTHSSHMDRLDPTSYYADWHRLLNGYGSQRCHKIPKNMSLCQNIGYDGMILPNYLQHEDLKEAVEQSQVWTSLAQTECHPDLRKFLCALYAPVCVDGHQEHLIHPCQNLCEDVRRSCLPKMLQFGFGWPDIVKCSRFPTSSTRMCIPLSQQRRLRCSGCVEEPTFESAISSFCMADIVLRAQIAYINKENSSNSRSVLLYLDRYSRTLKLPKEHINFGHLKIVVDCECNLLDVMTDSINSGSTKWLIMGKISSNRGVLHVEYLSRISRSNLGLKRALKAMRRPPSQLCKLPISDRLPSTNVKNRQLTTLYHTKSTPTRRSNTINTQNHINQPSNYFYSPSVSSLNNTNIDRTNRKISSPMSSYPNFREKHAARRLLVRRSQGALNKHTESKYFKNNNHKNKDIYQIRSNLNEYTKNPIHFQPYMQLSKSDKKLSIESENDLFSPQTISPWLR
ncbi:Secreted frizzled-related protein [Schistosoma japonicum]|uniref:Secreted frizzled-related protein n=2 Tax=Schistosoma japonicum TaxID=6182 RepID=A0A4Z2DE00_SCHJA|nr:Secreted frizzled-related protein [Schistosoma japonicum]